MQSQLSHGAPIAFPLFIPFFLLRQSNAIYIAVHNFICWLASGDWCQCTAQCGSSARCSLYIHSYSDCMSRSLCLCSYMLQLHTEY